MLPRLETDCGQHSSSLSTSAECPSLSSSFFSADFSTMGTHEQRRSSIASCTNSSPPDLFFTPSVGNTSPTTPMLVDANAHTMYKQCLEPVTYLGLYQPIYHLQDDDDDLDTSFWMMNQTNMVDNLSFGLPLSVNGPDTLPVSGNHSLYDTEHHGLSTIAANPSLTKSIFSGVGSCTSATTSDNELLSWSHSQAQVPSETIEPKATFQTSFSNSPRYKVEPLSPINVPMSSSTILTSSPLSLVSSLVVPSQQDVEELPYDLEEALRYGASKRHRLNPDRLYRRGYERKRLSGGSSKPKPALSTKTGINCELVIAQNEFPCSYAGCIDKTTGKQKRFKRQEHKKRHEKSVHEKSMHSAYKCWVPECNRAFSRTDNLKSHIRNTHSKRPGVRGNRYVATLDKNSEYYDPEWVGELDRLGYPIL